LLAPRVGTVRLPLPEHEEIPERLWPLADEESMQANVVQIGAFAVAVRAVNGRYLPLEQQDGLVSDGIEHGLENHLVQPTRVRVSGLVILLAGDGPGRGGKEQEKGE